MFVKRLGERRMRVICCRDAASAFRRRFPDIAREIGEQRTAPTASRTGPTEHDRLIARNAKLRRRNSDLSAQLAHAAAQIQHLSLRNERLQEALESTSNVTSIGSRIQNR
ncbi:hypothetical protein [Streptomyces hayashii]|uniref:hypothetical protein n=1 Tax=Streptomyces hayashii TaxID=2839966 RepID=UPI00403C54CF